MSQRQILDECWEWKGARTSDGYGRKKLSQCDRYTHRLAWAWANGPIPKDMHVLHRCDNPPCCNPGHLFLGTHADNMRDALRKGRHHEASLTHCKRGHEYDEENTLRRLVRSSRSGLLINKRTCRACVRENSRKYFLRRRDK